MQVIIPRGLLQALGSGADQHWCHPKERPQSQCLGAVRLLHPPLPDKALCQLLAQQSHFCLLSQQLQPSVVLGSTQKAGCVTPSSLNTGSRQHLPELLVQWSCFCELSQRVQPSVVPAKWQGGWGHPPLPLVAWKVMLARASSRAVLFLPEFVKVHSLLLHWKHQMAGQETSLIPPPIARWVTLLVLPAQWSHFCLNSAGRHNPMLPWEGCGQQIRADQVRIRHICQMWPLPNGAPWTRTPKNRIVGIDTVIEGPPPRPSSSLESKLLDWTYLTPQEQTLKGFNEYKSKKKKKGGKKIKKKKKKTTTTKPSKPF